MITLLDMVEWTLYAAQAIEVQIRSDLRLKAVEVATLM